MSKKAQLNKIKICIVDNKVFSNMFRFKMEFLVFFNYNIVVPQNKKMIKHILFYFPKS